MPLIDTGSTYGPQGRALRTAWVTLTASEARELLDSLQVWAQDATEGQIDPGWHTHISDEAGNELTIAIGTDQSS